jgi:mannose-6-phosphate isomerase-like protein (cupin superfamily)
MTKFSVKEWIDNVGAKWEPRDVAFVNDTALRIAMVNGAYEWHTHQEEDELFLVVKGRIFIDTKEGTVELNEMEGFVVKKGIRHRSRTEEPAWVLLVEPTRTKTLGH